MSIPAQFQRLLAHQADHVLFESERNRLTARELNERATAIAAHLQDISIEALSNVAIILPRGIRATSVIYAILKMGACYLPIDPQSPETRVLYILKNANVRCIIGSGAAPKWIENLDVHYVNIEDTTHLDSSFRAVEIHPEQRAALLYTSGSTGVPKGVAISHRAILAFAKWGQKTFSLTSNDRIANLAPYHFDLSLFDLFTAPLAGATTVTLPDRLKLSPAKLVDWLISNRISSWYTVPAILRFIILKGGLPTKTLPHLRQILFAGEVFPGKQLKQLSLLLPTTKLYNLFGPTETNVCLYWPVDPARIESKGVVPIGLPACGSKLKIDPDTQQLLVKSLCLMSGYIQENASATALPIDAKGWFHTGDKVSINRQGEYLYHGRLDRMIKCAGYRIEPAEIELALSRAPSVGACVVVTLDDPVSGTKIIAAVAGKNLDQLALRKHARQMLPAYMQPATYLIFDNLPSLSNGKIDYRTIQEIVRTKK